MNNAIQIKQVSKKFLLPTERITTLKESFIRLFKKPKSHLFHALNSVSFSVSKGTFLGVIGSNGSGKSTLLKILAGIYQADSGEVLVSGRVAPLLELGIGFQQELPARENIYLNAALLGMSKKEIDRELHAIVEFAELEQFLDVKIKNYSSGMRQRLAFAIATRVKADIYLCDEVLAVGDESFQQKCLQVFQSWKEQGKTIILVSHNTDQIKSFCDQAIWLDQGELEKEGSPAEVVAAYHANLQRKSQPDFSFSDLRITDLTIHNHTQTPENTFRTHQPILLRLHFHAKRPIENPVFGLAIHKSDGTHITGPNTKTSNFSIPLLQGQGWVECKLETTNLLAGTYLISASAFDYSCTRPFDYLDRTFAFHITESLSNQYGLIDLSPVWNIVMSTE